MILTFNAKQWSTAILTYYKVNKLFPNKTPESKFDLAIKNSRSTQGNHLNILGSKSSKLFVKGLGSIRGVFGPMSKISFTLSNYHFVISDKNYRRYFVI